MVNWIQKLLNRLSEFLNKKIVINIIKTLLVVWVFFVLLLYCYYRGYFYVVFRLSWPVFLIVLVLCFIFGNVKVDKNLFQKLVRRIVKKDAINIKFKSLFLAIPLMAIVLSNLFILYLSLKILFQATDFNYHIFNSAHQTITNIGPFYHAKIPFFLIVFMIAGVYLIWEKLNFIKYFKSIYQTFKNYSKQKKRTVLICVLAALTVLIAVPSVLTLINPTCRLAQLSAGDDILFSEINIFQKIFTTYLFYALLVLLVYALGRKILKLFKFYFDTQIELFIFSMGIGFAPFMLLTFFIALMGWLYAWVVWLIIVVFFILALSEIKAILKELNSLEYTLSFKTPHLSFKSLVLIGLLILLITNFIFAFKPAPTDFDSLHTYFNAPNLYVMYHEYKPLMHFSGSNMGQNTEMLYAGVLAILNSKFIVHFSLLFFILCLGGFYFLTKRLFGEKHAILALLTIYFVPWNFTYMYTNKVEFILAFYSLLMLYGFFLYYKNNFDKRYLYLAGTLAGAGMGIKYNAALLIVPLFACGFILQVIKTKKPLTSIKVFFISAFLAVLFFLPWAVKNQIYFKSILYPYSINEEMNYNLPIDQEYNKKRNEEIDYLNSSWEDTGQSWIINSAKIIWNKSIGKYYSAIHIDFGIAVLIFFPLGIFLIRDRKIFFNLLIAGLYFVLWLFVSQIRSWYAFFGFMLISALLPYILLRSRKTLYIYSAFMILAASCYALTVLPLNTLYVAGLLHKDKYLSIAVSHCNIAKTINALDLKEGEKIFMSDDVRVAFFKQNDKFFLTEWYYIVIGSWLKQGGEDYLQQKFKELNVRYVLYSNERHETCEQWLAGRGMTVTSYLDSYHGSIPSILEDEKKFLDFLYAEANLIAGDEYYTLFEMKY